MNNKLTLSTGALQAWTAALVFVLPSICLVTLTGVSVTSFLFLLTAIPLYPRGRAAVAYNWKNVRWVVFAFFYYLAFAAFCYMVRPVAPLSSMRSSELSATTCSLDRELCVSRSGASLFPDWPSSPLCLADPASEI